MSKTKDELTNKVMHLINVDYSNDVKLDLSQITNLPIIIEKYLSVHFELMIRINKLESIKNTTFGDRFKYYKEDYNILLTPAEIKNYLEADSTLNKVKEELGFYESLFKQVSEMIAELRSLQYILKTKLEYEKLINGAY